jgi:hypothetical protein
MQDSLPSVVGDEDTVEGSVSVSDTRISESIHSNDVLSVTQLLESVYCCPSESMCDETFFLQKYVYILD